jgi:predicted RNA polymerase sigma factor
MALNTTSYVVWTNKAAALFGLRRREDSEDEAIALKRTYAQAWAMKGLLLSSVERNIEAAAAFERSIVIDPYQASAAARHVRRKGRAFGSGGQPHCE